jgi:hypothetical protein
MPPTLIVVSNSTYENFARRYRIPLTKSNGTPKGWKQLSREIRAFENANLPPHPLLIRYVD